MEHEETHVTQRDDMPLVTQRDDMPLVTQPDDMPFVYGDCDIHIIYPSKTRWFYQPPINVSTESEYLT